MPAGGNFKSMIVNLSAAPGAAKSWQIQLSVNGTPSSSLTVTISGAASTTATVTADVAITAGDKVTIVVTPASSPTTSEMQVSLEWLPTTPDQFVYLGHTNGQISTAPIFQAVAHYGAQGGTDTVGGTNTTRAICPLAGTIRTFYVFLDAAPGAGKSYDFILSVAGSEVGSALNVADANTAGSQTGLSQAVTAGQTLSFKVKAATGTPAATRVGFGMVLEPATTGRYFWPLNDMTCADAVFWAANGGTNSGTETARQYSTPAGAGIYSAYIALSATPGVGNTRTFRSRLAAGNGAHAITIANPATTGNSTGVIDTLALGSLLDVGEVDSGTPSASNAVMALEVGPLLSQSQPYALGASRAAGRRGPWHALVSIP